MPGLCRSRRLKVEGNIQLGLVVRGSAKEELHRYHQESSKKLEEISVPRLGPRHAEESLVAVDRPAAVTSA